MKKFSEQTIKEVEKIYGKATKEQIEQALLAINNPEILEAYYESLEEEPRE